MNEPTPLLTTPRTFRVASLWNSLKPAAIVCGLAFVIVLIAGSGSTAPRWAYLLLAGVMVVGLLIGAWLMTRTRIVVSPTEIAYYSVGFAVRSTWDNVEGNTKRVLGIQSIEVLKLRQPGIEVSRWMAISYALMPVASAAAATQGRVLIPGSLARYQDIIPVGAIDENWRTGELGQIIGHYAPQALSNTLK